eukprot:TRINITY_DN283_c0_g1_i12.p1 TRINITY_DN283_c0_g1~~TRINITY_DN283_c0_g1_i12.p1  ORF type:complete len:809 (-),score=109.59 TRINITY_DN283_c0_g1_i12:2621-5047(-)
MLLVVFLCSCFTIVAVQDLPTSSLSVVGLNWEDIDAQFQYAAQQALTALEADPNDLDNVLQQLGSVLLTEIGDIVVGVLNGEDIDAEIASVDISDAVGNAIAVAASSGTMFEGIEVDDITQHIRTNVSRVLSNADTSSNVSDVTQEVANVVLTSVGNALADITGTSFSFKISVEASAEELTEENHKVGMAVTSGPIEPNLEFNDTLQRVEQEILDIMKRTIVMLANNKEDLSQLFTSLAADLQDILGTFALEIQQVEDIQERNISQPVINMIIQTLRSVQKEFTLLKDLDISKVGVQVGQITEAILAFDYPQIQFDILIQKLVEAILQPISKEVSDSLSVDFTFKVGTNGSTFKEQNKSQTGFLSAKPQLQVSMDILSSLSNTTAAFDLLKQAAANNQNVAIAASFLQAISTKKSEQLSQLLVPFYMENSISTNTLIYVTTLTVIQGGEPALNILTQSMQQIKDIDKLTSVFAQALGSGDEDITGAFIALVLDSIEDEVCGLSKIVEGMLEKVEGIQREVIIAQLEGEGASACVGKDEKEEDEVFLNQIPYLEEIYNMEGQLGIAFFVSPELASQYSFPSSFENSVETELDDQPEPEDEEDILEANYTDISAIFVQQESSTRIINNDNNISTVHSISIQPQVEEEECIDITPPGNYTCEDQARFGKCLAEWMIEGNFCQLTCGRCPQVSMLPVPYQKQKSPESEDKSTSSSSPLSSPPRKNSQIKDIKNSSVRTPNQDVIFEQSQPESMQYASDQLSCPTCATCSELDEDTVRQIVKETVQDTIDEVLTKFLQNQLIAQVVAELSQNK